MIYLKFVLILLSLVSDSLKCCNKCMKPREKYYSIVDNLGYCGEACINPAYEKIFKFFEPKLMHDETNSDVCKKNGYTKYNKTVTHHISFIKANVDLYTKP